MTNPLQSYGTAVMRKPALQILKTWESAYLPLQAGEIRLLKILSVPQVHESHAIEVTLVRQNLEHRTDYVAVSYAWGAPKLKKVLEIEDGTLVLITPNPWDFLCAQSRELAGQLLWIDQICIYSYRTATKYCRSLRFRPQF